MALIEGLGEHLAGLFDVKPETLKVMQDAKYLAQRDDTNKVVIGPPGSHIFQRDPNTGQLSLVYQVPTSGGAAQRPLFYQGRVTVPDPSAPGGFRTITPEGFVPPSEKTPTPRIFSYQGRVIVPDTSAPTGYRTVTPEGFVEKEDTSANDLAKKAQGALLRREQGKPEPGDEAIIKAWGEFTSTRAYNIAGGGAAGSIETRYNLRGMLAETAKTIAQNTEAGRFLAQQQAFTPEAIEGMVNEAYYTGKDPSMGFGPVIRSLFFDALNKKVESAGGWQNYAAERQLVLSLQGSQTALQRQRGLIDAFMRTNDRNLDLALQISDAVARTDVPQLNRLLMAASTMFNVQLLQVDNAENVAALRAAIRIASIETARVLSSATASGVLSDTARREIQELLDNNMTPQMVRHVIETFRVDMFNRQKAYVEEANIIMDMVRQRSAQPSMPTTVPVSPVPPFPGAPVIPGQPTVPGQPPTQPPRPGAGRSMLRFPYLGDIGDIWENVKEGIGSISGGRVPSILRPRQDVPPDVLQQLLKLGDPKTMPEGQTAGNGKYIIRGGKWQLNQK